MRSLLGQPVEQETSRTRVSVMPEDGFWRFAPDIPPWHRRVRIEGKWTRFHCVDGVDAKGRHDVVDEVFILVVPEYEDKIGLERVEMRTQRPNRGKAALTVHTGRRRACT